MRVVIAGAGSTGRSIAGELVNHGHTVMLIDRNPAQMKVSTLAKADWLLGDVCEITTLEQADIANCDAIVAATGDDKANLVLALLAKTEFAVPRVVARINNPKNDWLFDKTWGVDVAVSTPHLMTALVEEAVATGDIVPIFEFHDSQSAMMEVTIPEACPLIGKLVGSVDWPTDTVPTAIVRDGRPLVAEADNTFEEGDEILLIAPMDQQNRLQEIFNTAI